MYETVGRSRDGAEGARAMLCSRHGRSNSLSPGRARYAAGQLCSAARLRRPLMPPVVSGTAAAAEAAVTAGTSGTEEQVTSSSASPTQRCEAEQAASSTVDEASVDAARGDVGATENDDGAEQAIGQFFAFTVPRKAVFYIC